jgi:hypothetical protein
MATYASIKYDMTLSSNATGGGSLVLLSTQTASSSSTISFTSNIDSTYDAYMFKFYDIHAGTQNALFQVGFRDGGTDYDATKTTTLFGAYQYEDNNSQGLGYRSSRDLAQSTSFQDLIQYALISDGNDSCLVGTLHLFNPSSTTFVKHFMATTNSVNDGNGSDRDYTDNCFIAGYCNTTTAIDGVQFKMSTGNIDSGTIKLYGVA